MPNVMALNLYNFDEQLSKSVCQMDPAYNIAYYHIGRRRRRRRCHRIHVRETLHSANVEYTVYIQIHGMLLIIHMHKEFVWIKFTKS